MNELEKNHEELKKYSVAELVAELCRFRHVDKLKEELDKKGISIILKYPCRENKKWEPNYKIPKFENQEAKFNFFADRVAKWGKPKEECFKDCADDCPQK